MFCTKCGGQLPQDARFCTVCGQQVGAVTPPSPQAPGSEQLREKMQKSQTYHFCLSAGNSHTVGLKTNGTVIAVGSNQYGQCNTGDWSNIIAVSAGGYHTVGLKADGTVAVVGDRKWGQSDVENWNDIVAIVAGTIHTVGLKSDGTVIAVGDNNKIGDDLNTRVYCGQCDTAAWNNITAISRNQSLQTEQFSVLRGRKRMRRKTNNVILFACVVACLLVLAGCSNKTDKKALTENLTQTLKNAANIYDGEKEPDFISFMEGKSSYEIISMDKDGELITAKVKVKSLDLYTVIKNFDGQGQNMSGSEMDRLIIEELKSAQMLETEHELQFELVNGKYQPVLTESFLDAYYGGIIRLRQEQLQAIVGEEE